MDVTVYREAFLAFPAAHGAHAAADVGGDFLPGIEPVVGCAAHQRQF
jgi:hypothetical protein